MGVKLTEAAAEQRPADSIRQAAAHFEHAGRLIPNLDAMVEDLGLLGKGIVREVKVSIKR